MNSTELDLDELAARATKAAQTWAPGAEVASVQPLSGGASSLTFLATVEGGPEAFGRVVLKVAPPGLEPVRNRDVARQARLMRALSEVPGVRVPLVLFEDDGAPPDVPPFHAMNLVPGECREPLLENPPPDILPFVPGRAHDAARMLAALHKVDPSEVGLGDERVYTLENEVGRWTKAFSTVDDDLRERHEEADDLLRNTAPPALPPSIVHGDYRLGNTLCDGEEVTALIDWEIWSISDPRIDLAWYLFFTPEAKHPMAHSTGESGMPSEADLFATYVEAAGHEPEHIEWFHCLTRYKEAAATSLLFKRARKAGQSFGGGDTAAEIRSMTAECIERLQRYSA